MKINAKRAFLVTDSHFGARSNSNEWLELILDYFYNDFIPRVKAEYKEGDILIHCGDFFDNRQSINLSVLHESIKLMEIFSSIFKDGVYVMVGNHDIFRKTSNEITSLESFKYIPGIKIVKETLILELPTKNLMLMPWQTSSEAEIAEIKKFESFKPEYLFCHTDIKTFDFDKYRKIEEGLELKHLVQFKRVYTGHIHTAQKHKNVVVLGNSYQMTRSDSNNKKGFYLVDFETDKEKFFENKRSPKFIRVYLHKHLDNTIEELMEICKNNKVDLYVDSVLLKYQIQIAQIIDTLSKVAIKLEIIPFEANTERGVDDEELEQNFNILGLCERYVKSLTYADDVKIKLIDRIESMYNSILKEMR